MKENYRARLVYYLLSMRQVRRMQALGIFTPIESSVIDTMLAEKYGIASSSIYAGVDLIYTEIRGNMPHYKEVAGCQKSRRSRKRH